MNNDDFILKQIESEIKYNLNLTKARIYVTIFWHNNGITAKELFNKILKEYPVSKKTVNNSIKELIRNKLIIHVKPSKKYFVNKDHPHYRITEDYYTLKHALGVYDDNELKTSINCIWIYEMLLRAIQNIQRTKFTKNSYKTSARNEFETVIKDLGKILLMYKKYDTYNPLNPLLNSKTIDQVETDLRNLILAYNKKIIQQKI